MRVSNPARLSLIILGVTLAATSCDRCSRVAELAPDSGLRSEAAPQASAGEELERFTSAEQFLSRIGELECGRRRRCGWTSLKAMVGLCENDFARWWGDPQRMQFQPSAASACVALFKAHENHCTATTIDEVCASVFVGSRKQGERCESDQECAGPGLYCAGPRCAQTCQREGSGGAQCRDAEPRCNEGLGCVLDSFSCVALQPAGSECSADSVCLSGACDETSGKCAALPAVGERCVLPEWKAGEFVSLAELDRPICMPGLRCDRGQSKCVPLGREGDACELPKECAAAFGCVRGKCSRVGEGSPCSESGFECPAGLECDSLLQQCHRRVSVGLGESCTGLSFSARSCEGGLTCVGVDPEKRKPGRCEVAAIGLPCSRPTQCPAGAFCDESGGEPGICRAASPGTSCVSSAQCLPNEYCARPGRCLPRQSEGATCTATEACAAPMVCAAQGNGNVCLRTVDLGEACAKNPCRTPLTCVDGQCVVRLSRGALCENDAQCASGRCDNASGKRRCGPLAKPQETCRSSDECSSGDCVEGQCLAACSTG